MGVLKWITQPNRKIEIFITPYAVLVGIYARRNFYLVTFFKQVCKSDFGDLPSVVFGDIRFFKPKAKVESHQEIIKIKTKARSRADTKLLVKSAKIKL